MKSKSSMLAFLSILTVSALLAGPTQGEPASRPESTPAEPPSRESLDARISQASRAFYQMQVNSETAVPADVLARAKGVIILVRTSGSAGIGATGGQGVGFKKGPDGLFSSPAFYTVGGASLGVQIGGSETTTVALLMSDDALRALVDSQFVWSGNARAIADTKSTGASTLDDGADVVIYQRSEGLEIGAALAGTQVSVDNDANRAYYSSPFITPAEIFNLNGRPPVAAEALVMNLNTGAVGWNRAYAALQGWKNQPDAATSASASHARESRPPQAANQPVAERLPAS